MKTVYLHIGAHKTGTSAIQHFLWKNRQQLASSGYLYPELGRGGYSHGVLANIIKPNNADSRLAVYRKRFQEEVLDSGYPHVILSSEVFLEGANIAAAARDFLRSDKCHVRVIVFLRNQCDWLESVYHEVVRDPYRRYTGDIEHMREYEQGLHRYQKLLAPWVEAFGPEAIELCPYEVARSTTGINQQLLSLVGVDEETFTDFEMSSEVHNPRLHALASEFLVRINRYPLLNDEHQAIVRDLQRLSPELERLFGSGFFRMSESMRKSVRAELIETNRRIFEQYSCCGPQPLFSETGERQGSRDARQEFDLKVQQEILEGLSPEVMGYIGSVVPEIRDGNGCGFLLPPPSSDEVQRLNDVIMRQRSELRRMYEQRSA